MSVSGGYRSRGGESRFYCPPALRRHNNNQQQQQQSHPQRPSKLWKAKSKSSVDSEKNIESSDDCASTSTATTAISSHLSSPRLSNFTNLDRFLEHTTPIVPAQYFSKMSMRKWRNQEDSIHPFFILGDLWESFKEWSAYGAGVPLVLNACDSVVQYYVPYLSGIQLYVDPSKPPVRLRRPGEETDSDSSRESSSDGSGECRFNRLVVGDESEISNPPRQLIFEYLEQAPPYSREPLADKISALVSRFPELRTYRSCDLAPASWVSVAWYPIYRIPTGPTLQNLDACFLTFHSLSTPFKDGGSVSTQLNGSAAAGEMSLKLSLPIFGLASYKFKASVWNPNGALESQKVNSLLRAADNWIQLLRVNHPDYRFFSSHTTHWR